MPHTSMALHHITYPGTELQDDKENSQAAPQPVKRIQPTASAAHKATTKINALSTENRIADTQQPVIIKHDGSDYLNHQELQAVLQEMGDKTMARLEARARINNCKLVDDDEIRCQTRKERQDKACRKAKMMKFIPLVLDSFQQIQDYDNSVVSVQCLPMGGDCVVDVDGAAVELERTVIMYACNGGVVASHGDDDDDEDDNNAMDVDDGDDDLANNISYGSASVKSTRKASHTRDEQQVPCTASGKTPKDIAMHVNTHLADHGTSSDSSSSRPLANGSSEKLADGRLSDPEESASIQLLIPVMMKGAKPMPTHPGNFLKKVQKQVGLNPVRVADIRIPGVDDGIIRIRCMPQHPHLVAVSVSLQGIFLVDIQEALDCAQQVLDSKDFKQYQRPRFKGSCPTICIWGPDMIDDGTLEFTQEGSIACPELHGPSAESDSEADLDTPLRWSEDRAGHLLTVLPGGIIAHIHVQLPDTARLGRGTAQRDAGHASPTSLATPPLRVTHRYYRGPHVEGVNDVCWLRGDSALGCHAFASVGEGGEVALWAVGQDKPITAMKLYQGAANAIAATAFDPNILVAGGFEHVSFLRLHKAYCTTTDTSQQDAHEPQPAPTTAGTRISCTKNHTLEKCNINQIEFSPAQPHMFAVSDGHDRVTIWDLSAKGWNGYTPCPHIPEMRFVYGLHFDSPDDMCWWPRHSPGSFLLATCSNALEYSKQPKQTEQLIISYVVQMWSPAADFLTRQFKAGTAVFREAIKMMKKAGSQK